MQGQEDDKDMEEIKTMFKQLLRVQTAQQQQQKQESEMKEMLQEFIKSQTQQPPRRRISSHCQKTRHTVENCFQLKTCYKC